VHKILVINELVQRGCVGTAITPFFRSYIQYSGLSVTNMPTGFLSFE
jgi:hypothetical protein